MSPSSSTSLPNVESGDANLLEAGQRKEEQARSCIGTATEWDINASKVPYQSQQILISWIFIVASITLFFDFAALQGLVAGHVDSYFVKLCNWFGVVMRPMVLGLRGLVPLACKDWCAILESSRRLDETFSSGVLQPAAHDWYGWHTRWCRNLVVKPDWNLLLPHRQHHLLH